MDHSQMDHGQEDQGKIDHDAMDHDMTHSGGDSMSGMDMGSMQGGKAPPDARDPDAYAEGVDSGPMRGMDMADDAWFGRLLIDKLEYVKSREPDAGVLDAHAWYGGDYDKVWVKAEGERVSGEIEAARIEALWDHAIAAFWSLQLGARHDFGEGPDRNWAALGIQGLAPYWFEVEATAYAGPAGRTAARLEVEYDLLLTQRLILQPDLGATLYGKSDPELGIGSGISTLDVGLRLRYEIRRQFAPYAGVVYTQKFGQTADLARAADEDTHDIKFVLGVRAWF